LRLEEWEGFLFVTQDPDAPDLSPRLAGLTEVVGRFRMAGYVPVHRQVDVWDTNWKLLYENFMDAYHVFKVHKNSFAKNGDNTLKTTMAAGTDHFAYHLVGHDADASAGVAHPSNTSLEDEWRHTIVLGARSDTRDAVAAGLAVVPATEPTRHRAGADPLGRVGRSRCWRTRPTPMPTSLICWTCSTW
jgi:phenylpropionate dioxygenase-like ring-hydroxylating dioxygenase large terminal subunit